MDKIMNIVNLVTIIILYIQMIFCFFLNAISLSFIIYSRAFTPINLLIINLAISDILYSSCVPFYVRQFSNALVSQSELGCRLSFILDVTSMLVNVFTVAALTLERYFCIQEKKMVENDKSKSKFVIIYIIILWTFAITFSMPKTLSIVRVYNNETDTYFCGSLLKQSHEEIYTIAKWLIAFALPYVIIILFSTLLLKFLKEWSAKSKLLHMSHKPKNVKLKPITLSIAAKKNEGSKLTSESTMLCENNINKNRKLETIYPLENIATSEQKMFLFSCFNSNKSKKSSETKIKALVVKPNQKANRTVIIKRRTTRFVLAVVISFLCAWSPLWIFQIVVTFSETESLFLKLMSNITLIIVYFGGVVNPLLYMILTNNFREFISDKLKKFF